MSGKEGALGEKDGGDGRATVDQNYAGKVLLLYTCPVSHAETNLLCSADAAMWDAGSR